MTKTVKIGRYTLFADDTPETGLCVLQNGVNYERHIREELERLAPLATAFLDIGANVGVHSLNVKDINPNCKVFAVDMVQNNIRHLCTTASFNRLTDFTIIPVAAGTRAGLVAVNDDPSNACASEELTSGYTHWQPVLPISFYNLPPIDLIKADVEGFEMNVWRGMEGVLSRRPPMIFELCLELLYRSHVSPTEQLQWLVDRGYQLTVLDYLQTGTRSQPMTDPAAVLDHIERTSRWIADLLAEPCG